MKKLLFILLFSTAIFAGQINVAVAANVSYAINELIATFNKTHPNTKVRVISGSSGKLTAKARNGAPYDILMSANMKYPQNLYDAKVAITEPKVYAQGSLAILSTKPRNLSLGIALLLDSSIQKIAIANPKTAPYGVAAFEALAKARILDSLISKFVYGESISQTVSYAMIATDVGIIATSSLYSAKMTHFKENIHWKMIDTQFYRPIDQGIVLLKKAKNSSEAKAFYQFILSDEAKTIFKNYGYILPN